MRTINQAKIDLSRLRVAAIINTASGTCDDSCEEKLRSIGERNRVDLVSFAVVEGGGLLEALEDLNKRSADVLIVLGGDGTIRTAAERCMDARVRLLPLPGGTMNMLPRALYGEGRWDEILQRTLEEPSQIDVSGVAVEEHHFFCAGIFGAPALWGDAREEVRKSHWIAAVRAAAKAYHRTFSRRLAYRTSEGLHGKATAVSVICPLISNRLSRDDTMFELAALKLEGVNDAIQLAWTALIANWREDDRVNSVATKCVRLKGKGLIPAILDGEKVVLHKTATITIKEKCFQAIVPVTEYGPMPD